MDYLCSAYHALHPPNEGEIHPSGRQKIGSWDLIICHWSAEGCRPANVTLVLSLQLLPVRRSVCHASKNGGRLHFHAPIGVLVNLISYGHERVVVEWENTFFIEHPIIDNKFIAIRDRNVNERQQNFPNWFKWAVKLVHST